MKKCIHIKRLITSLVLAVCVLFSGSVVFAAEADTTAPSQPANLRIDHSTGYIYLFWDDSTDNVGVDHYVIRIYNLTQVEIIQDTTTDTVYSFHGQSADMRDYRYEVAAVDAAGNRSEAAFYQFEGYTDQIAPSRPTNLTIDHKTGYVYVSWDASTDNVGVDHYEVTIYNRITNTSVQETTTSTWYSFHEDYDLRSYRYEVVAVDAAGNRSGVTSYEFENSIDEEAPSTPTNISILDGPTSMHLAKWDPSTDNVGVDHYEIILYHYNNPELNVYDTTTYTSYQWQTNGSDREYYRIDVIAVDAAGNRSAAAIQHLPYHPVS